MRALTFSGGLAIQAPSKIDTVQIETLPEPEQVTIPLKQHSGPSCTLLVKKGDAITKGEVIAESASTAIHATISGVVLDVLTGYTDLSGTVCTAVRIGPAELAQSGSKKAKKGKKGQKEDREEEDASPASPPREPNMPALEGARAMGKMLKAGLIDASARFGHPLLDKVRLAQEKKARTLLINGLDEFNLQGYQATLLAEAPDEVIAGVHALQEILNPHQVVIAVYENIYPAVTSLPQDEGTFRIVPLKARHPQHLEELLVKAVTKQEYPPEMAPEDLGVSVISLEAAYILGWVIKNNAPFLDSFVSVAGSPLDRPRNLRIRVGTPIRALLEFLDIAPDSVAKVVHGGPMSGTAIADLERPVTKRTGQIYLQSKGETISFPSKVCIKCGYCVQVCPMRLMPFMLSGFSEAGNYELAAKYDIFSCVECGCCAFVCPSKIPMVQWIQFGKSALMSDRSDHDAFAQACRLA